MTTRPWGGQSARARTSFGDFELRRSHLVTGGCPYPPGSVEAVDWYSVRGPAPAAASARDRVAVLVHEHARSTADERLLLDALGLV